MNKTVHKLFHYFFYFFKNCLGFVSADNAEIELYI